MNRGRQWILARPISRGFLLRLGVVLLLSLALMMWTARNIGLDPVEFVHGLPWVWDLLSRMFPPNWSFLHKLARPVAETLQIALWGTLLGGVLAVPVCFLAARNLSPHPLVFHGTRQVLNAARGINEIIFALVFVAAVGLGPFAGVLALSIHGAGMLGKFFAEAIEDVDPGPLEALRATGAHPAQVIVFGVMPQTLPSWIASLLYRLEVNLRTATVLGMIGAGGIGFELVSSMKLFQYQDTAVCVIVILVMVMVTDALSSRLRAKILAP
jgi:phosphonate transport system permease protein